MKIYSFQRQTNFLLLFILMSLFHFIESYGYSGYVGQTITLPAPSVPGTIGGAAWITSSNSHVSVTGDHYSATARILHYFTGTVTIDCQYSYAYYIGSKKYYGTGHEYYDITCIPSNITISKKEITIGVGDEYELGYSNSSGYEVDTYWESSDCKTAMILDGREYGKWISAQKVTIYGKAEGQAIITCDGFTGGPAQTCIVTVKKKVPIRISPFSGIVEKGSKVTITTPGESETEIYYTLNGSTPSKNSMKYPSDGITVNSSCTIKAIAYKSGYVESAIVSEDYELAIHPTDVKVEMPIKRIFVDEKTNPSSSLIPSNANVEKKVSWSSDNPNIATVDSKTGEVKGIQPGTTYIRANTEKGLSDVSKVEVFSSIAMTDVMKIALNSDYMSSRKFALLLKNDGTLWSSGINTYGQLGDGTTTDRNGFVKIMSDVADASVGWAHTLVVKKDGSLWAWGGNEHGQIGDGTTTDSTTPVKIMTDVKSVGAGRHHSLAVKKDGSLWAWGGNEYGQIGDGTTTDRKTPVKIMDNVSAASSSRFTTLILKKDGTLYGCGYNTHGELADGTTTHKKTPILITSDVAMASCGYTHTLVVKKDGSLWACGQTNAGKLGNGSSSSTGTKRSLIKVVDSGIISASAGYNHSLALDENGSLWGCGHNVYGKSDENADDTHFYKVIDSGVKLAEAGFGNCVIVRDYMNELNSTWVSGENVSGELGIGQIGEKFDTFVRLHAPLSPSVVTLNANQQSISTGKSIKLSYNLSNGITSEKVTWTSDDASIATVSSDGTVKGIKAGVTFINVTASNGDMDWCKVTVSGTNTKQTITTSSEGYATFYDADFSYSLPTGLTAQVVNLNTSGTLSYRTIANGDANGIIPKGVPVVLVSSNGSSSTYTLSTTNESASYTGSNLLHGSNSQTITSNVDGVSTSSNPNYVYYKLTYGKSNSVNANKFGWYWGADKGAGFSIAGGKAWLALPKSSGQSLNSMLFIGENVTSVDCIEQSSMNNTNDALYNMAGQRVSNGYKGIIIINGKKTYK